jgi:hypothetical protein
VEISGATAAACGGPAVSYSVWRWPRAAQLLEAGSEVWTETEMRRDGWVMGVRLRGPIGNIHRGNMKTVLKPYLEVFIF